MVYDYRHLDVFATAPLTGNGLAAFFMQGEAPSADLLLRITQEMRQFESIFLWRTERPGVVRARIFTTEEELGFAGHPLLGAAVAMHELDAPDAAVYRLRFALAGREVDVQSRRDGDAYLATMNQGIATFGAPLAREAALAFATALSLDADELHDTLPMQVVSTGLPYLIVPLRAGLERARIAASDFQARLHEIGAQFAYVVDVAAREGRTWDNAGRVEDIATGSAAGPTGAWLVAQGLEAHEAPIRLHQGRFLGRPSVLEVRVGADGRVDVSGRVVPVGRGRLEFAAPVDPVPNQG